MDDSTMYWKTDPEDLWIHDKLILSRKLGYVCGPHGVDVPRIGKYIIRPCVNFMGMGRGAYFDRFWTKTTDNKMPEGSFWCEIFKGKHISVDYVNKKQVLAVQGVRKTNTNLWRWSKWKKIESNIPYPDVLKKLKNNYKYINCEFIGDKLIEVHLRGNPDWALIPKAKELIPVFKDDIVIMPSEKYQWVDSKDFKRLGFYWK